MSDLDRSLDRLLLVLCRPSFTVIVNRDLHSGSMSPEGERNMPRSQLESSTAEEPFCEVQGGPYRRTWDFES